MYTLHKIYIVILCNYYVIRALNVLSHLIHKIAQELGIIIII